MFVAFMQVLQLFVQAWHIRLTPAKPDGHADKQELLYRAVPLMQDKQTAAPAHRLQGLLQAVH